ncbi:hypothetical protein IAR55_001832 [Kwoniella newhampshirensis]|uniref:Uncharacterized protein n=1 Tax=Kwoniella newhampshirensis TaxID=1651941 RepID=A0AAW0Z393_9TREE
MYDPNQHREGQHPSIVLPTSHPAIAEYRGPMRNDGPPFLRTCQSPLESSSCYPPIRSVSMYTVPVEWTSSVNNPYAPHIAYHSQNHTPHTDFTTAGTQFVHANSLGTRQIPAYRPSLPTDGLSRSTTSTSHKHTNWQNQASGEERQGQRQCQRPGGGSTLGSQQSQQVPFGPPPSQAWKPAPVHPLPRVTRLPASMPSVNGTTRGRIRHGGSAPPAPAPPCSSSWMMSSDPSSARTEESSRKTNEKQPHSSNSVPVRPESNVLRTQPSAPGAQPSIIPLLPRYLTLSSQAARDRLVFRVHSSSSISQLIWTGNPDTSGFFASAPVFAHLTPKAYQKSYGDLGEAWGMGSWIRGMMINHILCRPVQPLREAVAPSGPAHRGGRGGSIQPPRGRTIRGQGVPLIGPDGGNRTGQIQNRQEAESSCWISTTRSLDWAIYEISRRLSLPRMPNTESIIRLAVIRYDPQLTRSDGGRVQVKNRELRLVPWFYLNEAEPGIISVVKKERSVEARRKTNESYETLYWGRVFSQSIKEDLIWTRQHLPFMLPARFWRPDRQLKQGLARSEDSWLNHLRWDPTIDDWKSAQRKMRETHHPRTHWADRSIHNYSSAWPRKDVIVELDGDVNQVNKPEMKKREGTEKTDGETLRGNIRSTNQRPKAVSYAGSLLQFGSGA